MVSERWRLTTALLVAAIGLAAGATGSVTMAVPRCRSESGILACSSATMETEAPQPTPTIHVHVSFSGTVWDGTEGVPLADAQVAIAACEDYAYEVTTDAAGHYHSWLGTEGEFACGIVPYQVSKEDHETARRTVPYSRYLYEDFVRKRTARSALLLPVTVVDHAHKTR